MMTPKEKYNEWRETDHGQEIYAIAVEVCREMRAAGTLTNSARELVHEIRYRTDPRGRDRDGYKISNTHSPYLGDELEADGIVPPGWFTRHRRFRAGVETAPDPVMVPGELFPKEVPK